MSLVGPRLPIGDGCHAIPVIAERGSERGLIIEASNGITVGLTVSQIVKLMGAATSGRAREHWLVLERELGIH